MVTQSSELFTLTYGSLVLQLIEDFEDYAEVNNQLERMGNNIGQRLIEEFLAKSRVSKCGDFAETCEVIALVGFRMFLGVTGTVSQSAKEPHVCHITLASNPLLDFVELPDEAKGVLQYSNILVGVLKGALEMVQMRVDVEVVHDPLVGDEATELKLTLLEIINDEPPPDDE